ncbi:extracellular solute-binding protein [Desulfobulbus alkaliphilus]|uniref:extracellular solute-binding protein n=1 Tax=Desulfobulbus alkaliphilus TaxID=869814 RepID=UPI001965F770|nr:extracellular solute-binding protein [Desulfobulbus alkaliphilus]MBM9535592.1 extracellular solute-binding protein [Desulfobulbus alkaliphilus]
MKTLVSVLSTALLLLCLAASAHSSSRVLNLYIWSEYIPDEIVAAFTRETGIRVNVSTYDSNEAMYAKINLIGSGYDLVVPSSDFVGLMQREDLLLPVDTSKIPNFAHIASRFTNQSFDPGNQYSIPYMWGSTSIAVHTGMIAAESVQSMADLWQPELRGRLLLPNDPREVMAIGLKVLGYSVNETNPEHLQQAFEKLRTLMPLVRVFDSDSPKQALLSREVAVGVVWNGEAFIANSENPAIEYIYPPEGFSLWLDSFCIPRGAENIEAAHLFIDYVLRPEISAEISSTMGYSTPNKAAFAYLAPEIKDNRIVNPDPEDVARGEFLDSLDDATLQLYEQHWVNLKTGQ